jgi:2-methylcitrate dehydratase PrpD
LRRAHEIDPDAIESVTVSGDALLLARGDREVRNERDARVSIHHTAAVALLFGAAGLREYSPDMVADEGVRAFRSRVRAVLDRDLHRGAARVDLTLRDGRAVSATVLDARGSAAHPLSDGEIEAKVRDLAKRAGPRDVTAIIEAVWRLDSAPNVDGLMGFASAPA